MEYVLEVSNLSYTFADGTGIADLSLQVKQGSIYYIYGSHGSGKTVLLQLLIGTIFPQSGTVKLFGNSNDQKERQRIGYVPAKNYSIGRMNAAKLLHYYALSLGVLEDQFEPVLAIPMQEKKPVCRLPISMQHKINLGLALLGKPDLVIMDDPFADLDAGEREELCSILRYLNEVCNLTVILTGHNYDIASQVATHYGVITEGRIAAEFTQLQLQEFCQRCIKIRIPKAALPQAIPLLHDKNLQYEVLKEDLIRLFCPPSDSAKINTLLVGAGIEVAELWIAGIDPKEYLLQLAGGL